MTRPDEPKCWAAPGSPYDEDTIPDALAAYREHMARVACGGNPYDLSDYGRPRASELAWWQIVLIAASPMTAIVMIAGWWLS